MLCNFNVLICKINEDKLNPKITIVSLPTAWRVASFTIFDPSCAEIITKYSQSSFLILWTLKERYQMTLSKGNSKHDRFVGHLCQHKSLTRNIAGPSFPSCNPFSSWPSKAKDIHLQLRFSKRLILNKTEPLFKGFLWLQCAFLCFNQRNKKSWHSCSPHARESGFLFEIQEIFSEGIRHPWKFCPWNPESRVKTTLSLLLKYGTRNLEYHKRLEPEIQGPLTNTGIQY